MVYFPYAGPAILLPCGSKAAGAGSKDNLRGGPRRPDHRTTAGKNKEEGRNMRKVLALILAVTMLLTLNVGALAADTTKAVDSGITLSHTTVNILPGKSFVLVPALTPDTGWALTWSSSDTEVVTVDEHGVLTAVKVGRATVTAAARDNPAISASCVVNVVDESAYEGVPVQHIKLPYNATVRVGGSKTLTAAITPENATNKTLIWTSENEDYLTVDDNGVITGVAPTEGDFESFSVVVRATSEDGNHWDECLVTVIGEDAPAILVDRRYAPGETVKRFASVNESGDQMHGIGYISDCDVTACSAKKGLLRVYAELGNIWIGPAAPRHAVGDVNTKIEDTMVLTLSDGSSYEFPVVLTFNADIDQELSDAEDGISIHRIPMGRTYTFTLEILDIANVGVQPYTVEIKEEGDSGVLRIGDFAVEGKTARIPITPLRVGSVELDIDITDASGEQECRVGYPVDVIPEDTAPILTPGSFDKDDAGDNEANSGETLADIAAANDALTTGGTLPKEVINATTAGGATVPAIPVKLTTGSANLFVGTADLIGAGKVGLLANVNNGAMTVLLPGGFGKVSEPGRVYFPLDFESSPKYAAEMLSAVKTEGAKSEAVKAGGAMTMPAAVTVTLKTRLEGTVNVYLYNEDTGRFTLVASPAAKDGRITFATRQMGYLLLTTGRV